MKKNIIIFFGEMGAGKNYIGERVAKILDLPFFDGDLVATPEMIEKVKTFKPLNRQIVIKFVEHLANEIDARAKKSNGLIVAQALYFDEDRRFLESYLTRLGYKVQLHWVRTTFFRNLKQIFSRPRGLRWVIYWLSNKMWFQKPTHNLT